MTKTLYVLLMIALGGAVLLCIGLIATTDLTGRESLFLSIVLTIVSIFGSWLASRYYAESTFNASLRVFALKAAEKVNNLSNELDRLAIYLQQELDQKDYSSADEALLVRDMRIESAVHVIGTLKSVNDRSLSDWQGVIGDEIDAQRVEREEREDEIRHLIERVENLYSEQMQDLATAQGASTDALRNELNAVRGELRLLMAPTAPPVRRAKMRRTEEIPCPACRHLLEFRQKPKTGSFKSTTCRACGQRVFTWYDGDQFQISIRKSVNEPVNCPSCGNGFSVPLDNYPYGPSVEMPCPMCDIGLRVSRGPQAINVKIVEQQLSQPAATEITAELIQKVRERMPAQPWPKGASQTVRQQLGLRSGDMQRILHELVRRGEFKLQIEGTLYEPVLKRDGGPS